MDRILAFSVQRRWLVLCATFVVAGLGVHDFGRLPIDAVPDITNVQVQVNTAVQALSPLEVEKLVTFPVERAMTGIPGGTEVRSLSRFGLSQVTIVFEDRTDIHFARQLVNQRLQEARESLPGGLAEPVMGPISSGLGEIYLWTVEAEAHARTPDGRPYDLTDLRTVQDWIVKPQLRTVPGVTEVNAIGGYEKQFHVTPDPASLLAHGLTFRDVFEALAMNNSNAGGGYIEHHDEQYLVRTTGIVESVADIGNIVLDARDGAPLCIRDVARVDVGKELRTGAATQRGVEAVIGTAIMLMGENSRTVSSRVAARMEDVNRSLPAGVHARTIYDRSELVEATLSTVRKNLLEGAALVAAVLFLLLGNLRAALIVTLAIPLSMLVAISGMVQAGISGNLMSLGAIDFGIIVDGAIVMVENIVRRFAERQRALGRRMTVRERLGEAFTSSSEVARPTFFGVAIIMIVYLPILALTGIEGKMFRPMAGVVLLALAGALLLTFTFVPAAAAVFLRGRVAEGENAVLRAIGRAYGPTLERAVRWRWFVASTAAGLVVACGWLSTRLGTEFAPTLGEGALAVQAARIPSISLTRSLAMQGQLERLILAEFPDEVANVFARTGTAEVATDPMGPNVTDTYVMLTPQAQWKRARTQEELAGKMGNALGRLAGQNFEISQPIELRFNELIAGVRGDVAVKVFGDDLEDMSASAERIAAVLRSIRGSADVKVEQTSGLPVLTIDVDRARIARYGLNVADVQGVVETALGGSVAGEMLDGDRRFDIVVRLPDAIRSDVRGVENLPVPLPVDEPGDLAHAGLGGASMADGRPSHVPLGAVAHVRLEEGPNQVSREDGKRRVVVQANVRGRDLGSFVAEAQRRVRAEVELPPGHWLSWGGQYENLMAANERLSIVVPAALALILALLFWSFGSVRHALLVFTGVPTALTGGVIALWLRGLPLSVSAAVGFIALSGVAVLNGLVLVNTINTLRKRGASVDEAIRTGSRARLRSALMAGLAPSLGFVPMALAHGTGAEVQRPIATVVIGGVLSATFLTLVVLPALYRIFERDKPRAEEA